MRRKAALIEIRYHFHEINADEQLTSEHKKQIRDFYLHNFIAPEARKALEKYYPQEFGSSRSKVQSEQRTRFATSKPHPDR